jgi:hypothetical protein
MVRGIVQLYFVMTVMNRLAREREFFDQQNTHQYAIELVSQVFGFQK